MAVQHWLVLQEEQGREAAGEEAAMALDWVGWVGPPSPFPCTHSCSETLAKCLELGPFSMCKIDFKTVLVI